MEASSPMWLEILKLAVSVATALAVVVVGYYLTSATKRVEAMQWASQTVIERRLEIFSVVAPKLNRLLCFALFIGTWKDLTPHDVIRLKREADETMHVNRFLFSDELFATYVGFMDTLFAHFSRTDCDAPIRADIANRLGDRRKLPWWNPQLTSCFADPPHPTAADLRSSYDALGEAFRRDLYVTRRELHVDSQAASPRRHP
jgi:hypothetical protein